MMAILSPGSFPGAGGRGIPRWAPVAGNERPSVQYPLCRPPRSGRCLGARPPRCCGPTVRSAQTARLGGAFGDCQRGRGEGARKDRVLVLMRGRGGGGGREQTTRHEGRRGWSVRPPSLFKQRPCPSTVEFGGACCNWSDCVPCALCDTLGSEMHDVHVLCHGS